MTQPPKLLAQVRDKLQEQYSSIRTLESYSYFHRKQHPNDMSVYHINVFFAHLLVELK